MGKWKVLYEIYIQQVTRLVREIINSNLQCHHVQKAAIIYLPVKKEAWGSASLQAYWAAQKSRQEC